MIASLPLVQIECTAVGEPHDLRVGGECAPVHGAGPHSHVLTRFWKFVEKIFLRFSNNKAMREITVRPRDFQTWWGRINTASVTFITNCLESTHILVQGWTVLNLPALQVCETGILKVCQRRIIGEGVITGGVWPTHTRAHEAADGGHVTCNRVYLKK